MARAAVLSAVVLAGAALWWFVRDGRPPPSDPPGSDAREEPGTVLVPTTATASEARAARVLPTEGTEDASHLLPFPVVPAVGPGPEHRNGPREGTDWVIDVTLPPGTAVGLRDVRAAFPGDWAKAAGDATLYGYSEERKAWGWIAASDGAPTWSRLAVAMDYVVTFDEEPAPTPQERFEALLGLVRERAAVLGAAAVSPRLTPAEAAARSRALFDLWRACDREVVVVLEAPADRPFEGRDLWDVMLCLGLKWGDMDLFHWPNRLDAPGGDELFSVWTGTQPGYFLPELIAAGEMRVRDLRFGFSVPRSAAPREVFDAMLAAIEYARKRLGGTITDAEGRPLDAEGERQAIEAVIEQLRAAGFEPGQDATLRLF